MFDGIISVLDTGIRAFLDITRQPDAYAEAFANDDFEKAGLALDVLYFEDDGVLSVLRDIAADRTLTHAHSDRVWRFNEVAPEVSRALRDLHDTAADQLKMSKEDRLHLKAISKLKTGLRWDVMQVANQRLSRDLEYDLDDVAELVRKIEAFNEAIVAADKRLRMMRKI